MWNKEKLTKFVTSSCLIFGIASFSFGYSINTAFINFNHPKEALNIVFKYLPIDPIIVDAGAFDGSESVLMADRWPKGHVHTFEPIPELYELVKENANTRNNITPYELALSDNDGIAEMYISEFSHFIPSIPDRPPGTASHSSSLRQPKEHFDHAPHVVFPRTIQVNTNTLDTWAKNNNIDHVDMLWMDIQGVELEVLKASPNILKGVLAVIMEVEFVEAYEGQYLYYDIKNWMEKQGFFLKACNFNPNDPRLDNAYCGDALFIRNNLMTTQ